MKLSLVLSILLLFAGGVWAEEDKFPIQLTCEVGSFVLYLNLEKDSKDSWWKNSDLNYDLVPSIVWTKEKYSGKNQFKKYKINDSSILLSARFKSFDMSINRLTGKVSILSASSWGPYSSEGKCFNGFKEHKGRKF